MYFVLDNFKFSLSKIGLFNYTPCSDNVVLSKPKGDDSLEFFRCILGTVDSRYLEIEGTLKNSSRYPYFDISDL